LSIEYDISHFVLSALYIVVIVLAILWRIRKAHQNYWQKFFAIFLLTGAVSRLVFFAIQPFVYEGAVPRLDPKLNIYLNTIPTFPILSCYVVVLFLWAELYHSDSDSPPNTRKYFGFVMSAIYFVLVALIVCDFILMPVLPQEKIPLATTLLETIIFTYTGALYIAVSIGFALYGYRFYVRFSDVPSLMGVVKFELLPRVKLLASLCVVIFTIRGACVIWDTYSPWPAEWWWVDLVYYTLLEVVPIILMLRILKAKLRRRDSERYSQVPINLNERGEPYRSSDSSDIHVVQK